MTFWGVVFVVLMLIWLFGGLFVYWPSAGPGPAWAPVGAHFLCWCCVAILGYIVLGGGGGPVIVR